MNLIKTKGIKIFLIFIFSFFFHNIYKWFPNDFTAIFFPVNESIWEHMKMLFTDVLFISIIEYIYTNKFNIKNNNLEIILSPVLSVIIYLFIYSLLLFIKHNLFSYLLIMLLSLILTEIINYKFRNYRTINNKYIYLFIIISYLIFGYLTYHPIKSDLFLDPLNNQYGINYFIIG